MQAVFFAIGMVHRVLVAAAKLCYVITMRWQAFSAICLAAFLASCASHQVFEEDRSYMVTGEATPASVTAMRGLLRQTGPSYVTLTVSESHKRSKSAQSDPSLAVSSGSGFIVDKSGYVLTAAHVAIQKGYTVTARGSDGRLYSGKVVEITPTNDMALIKLSGFEGTPVHPVPDPCLTRGETVYTLGKPHAQGDTARIGQVETMHFGRPVQYGAFGYPDAIVMRMSTQKGESGGPVFNQVGELSGMVVSTLSDGNGQPLNLAHAVPSTSLASFLCGNISCSSDWMALSKRSTNSCPQS
jgi:S1-C subfamily serine protease